MRNTNHSPFPAASLRYLAAAIALLFAATPAKADYSRDDHLRTLKENGVAADTPSLVAFLESQLGDEDVTETVGKLIEQLGDSKYAVREEAEAKLVVIGMPAMGQLVRAAKSDDLEVSFRANEAMAKIESPAAADRRAAIQAAIFFLLKERKDTSAAPALLVTIDLLAGTYLRDSACEALWASVDKSHVELLKPKLESEHADTCAVAILALAAADPERAEANLTAFLEDKRDAVRLAACRALVDLQPRTVAEVLVNLAGSEDANVAAQADALLTLMSGSEQQFAADNPPEKAWGQWRDKELETAKLISLGDKRFDLSIGRRYLIENFHTDIADATKGYGRFTYEATVASKASVERGILKLDGQHDEADQRLMITSQRLTGRDTWPSEFVVRAKMGGEADGSGGYHVGLSVGDIKAIFHPDYNGGAFRMETVDGHDYVVSNTDLSFTPQGSRLYETSMKVTRLEGKTRFEVEILDTDSTAKFQRTFEFDSAVVGEFNRVGLERSGRAGGAALFDDVRIELRK